MVCDYQVSYFILCLYFLLHVCVLFIFSTLQRAQPHLCISNFLSFPLSLFVFHSVPIPLSLSTEKYCFFWKLQQETHAVLVKTKTSPGVANYSTLNKKEKKKKKKISAWTKQKIIEYWIFEIKKKEILLGIGTWSEGICHHRLIVQ